MVAAAGALVATPSLPAGASTTSLSAVVQGTTGTIPTVGNPVPAATAKMSSLSYSTVTPSTGNVAIISGNQVFLLVNAAGEPASDYGLGTGTLTQGDVYLVVGNGTPGWTSQVSNTATAPGTPVKASTTIEGKPQVVTFDPAGNLLIGSNITGEANVVLVPKSTGPAYGFPSAMAGFGYFIAGFTPNTASSPPAPAIRLPSAITFTSLAATSGIKSGSNQDVVVGTPTGVSLLNYGTAQTYYGTSEGADTYTAVAGGGTATCTAGAQNVPATGASSFGILGASRVFVDANGALYVGNASTTGCSWVLPKTTGTLVLGGTNTAVTAGTAYKWAGNGTSAKTTAPTNGASAVTTSVGVVNGVTEDQAGNLVFVMGGNTATTTKINGAYVIANTNGTYYGQAMTAGHFYTIAGSASHVLSGTFRSPVGIGGDNTGDVFLSDANTHQLYKLTGGPVGAPIVTGVHPSSGKASGGTTVTVEGSGLNGVTAVTFGGTAVTSIGSSNGKTVQVVIPNHAAATVAVAVTTPQGTATLTGAFTYLPPPTITSVSPATGFTTGGTTVVITGANLAGTTAVTFGGSAATTVHVVGTATSATVTAKTPPHAKGAVAVKVTAGGGTVTKPNAFTYVAAPATITTVTPSSGTILGGTTVTITGTNLATTSAVTFGGTAATNLHGVTATSVTVKTPAHAKGVVTVAVTTTGGTVSKPTAFTYVVSPPTVTSVVAAKGKAAGGTTVTINGTSMTTTTAVTFGGVAGTTLQVVSDSSVTVKTPAHAAGSVAVKVTTTGGTATKPNAFTYVAPPTVSAVAPVGGSTAGGTTVTITGTSLTTVTSVTFGGTAATTVHASSSTTATAKAPAHAAGPVDVVVTTPFGTTTDPGAFTYATPPTVTSVTPATGNHAGGTTVTITGTHLTGATVTFGGVPATTVQGTGPTTLTAVDPSHLAGQASVVVTTLGGSASLATGFAYAATAPAQPTGSTIWTTGTSTSSTDTATAKAAGVQASGSGAGAVGAGVYTSNPTTGTVSGGTGVYYDVAVGDGSNFSSVTITACTLAGGNTLDWWNGTAWKAFSAQTFDATTGCVTATVNGTTSPTLAELTGTPITAVKVITTPPVTTSTGYWEAASDGGIFAFGDAKFYGSMGGQPLNKPIVNMAATADGKGYWEVATDGGVFSFGDAAFYGSMGGQPLNEPIVDLVPTADGKGYWEVASDGGIFAFGDAAFYGSMGGQPLNEPVVALAATPDGKGYWEVASDGGLFAFGDAQFYGSMGGKPLNAEIVGMTATASGQGYWMVGTDGGLFAFGDAQFFGSMGGKPLNKPVVGMTATASGQGYWMVASDGGIFAFGDAKFAGSMGGQPLNAPIVGIAAVIAT